MDHHFFFSYSRIDHGAYLEKFFNDLRSEVHKKVVKVKGRNGAKEKSLRAYNLYFPHNPIKKYHDGVIDALLICVHEKIKNKEKLRKWEFVSCLSLF